MSTFFMKQYNSENFALSRMIFYGSVGMKDSDATHDKALKEAQKEIAPVMKFLEDNWSDQFKNLKSFTPIKFAPSIKVDGHTNSKTNNYLYSYKLNLDPLNKASASLSPRFEINLHILLDKAPSTADQKDADKIFMNLNKKLREQLYKK